MVDFGKYFANSLRSVFTTRRFVAGNALLGISVYVLQALINDKFPRLNSPADFVTHAAVFAFVFLTVASFFEALGKTISYAWKNNRR